MKIHRQFGCLLTMLCLTVGLFASCGKKPDVSDDASTASVSGGQTGETGDIQSGFSTDAMSGSGSTNQQISSGIKTTDKVGPTTTKKQDIGNNTREGNTIKQITPPSKFTPLAPPTLAAGVPQRSPKTLGNMTMNNLLYKTKQETGIIDYIDLRSVDGSVRIAALCLQGLVSRNNTASIYFATCDSDIYWKNYIEKRYKVKFQEITANEMFYKYAPFVKKMVIYDWPSGNTDPYQMVMAINMAAISDGLPVTHGLLDLMVDEGWYSKSIVKEDISRKWKNKQEAYDWGIKNVLPQCNKNYVGACDANDTIWDYLYATKSFSFWLDYKNNSEKALIDRILSGGYTLPGMVFGYGEHGDELLHATGPKGFAYLVSDYFVNATYLCSFPDPKKTYSQNSVNSSLKGKNGVMYISLYISDGDNIQFNQKASQILWDNTTDRGRNPVALEINPALYEMAPPMLEWFHAQRTKNDELMGGPAGFSYIWEDEFMDNTSVWDAWHGINNYFLNKSNMRVVASSRIPNSNNSNHFMRKSSIIGSLDWGDPFEGEQVFSGEAYFYDNKPIIVSTNCARDIAPKLVGLTPNPNKPLFYSLCITQAALGEGANGFAGGYKYINEQIEIVKKKFGDKVQFVLPSDLLVMAKNSK